MQLQPLTTATVRQPAVIKPLVWVATTAEFTSFPDQHHHCRQRQPHERRPLLPASPGCSARAARPLVKSAVAAAREAAPAPSRTASLRMNKNNNRRRNCAVAGSVAARLTTTELSPTVSSNSHGRTVMLRKVLLRAFLAVMTFRIRTLNGSWIDGSPCRRFVCSRLRRSQPRFDSIDDMVGVDIEVVIVSKFAVFFLFSFTCLILV